MGIVWNPSSDKFRFTISKSNSLKAESVTKRQMLSDIAHTFDPLGWLIPVINSLKCLMQKAWIAKLDWDQTLPVDLSREYMDWRERLGCIEMIELDRFVLKKDNLDSFDLHVFCDASEHGYAACVFVISQNNGERRSSLLVAKSKVVPIKSKTVPRLELCAARLGCRLLSSVIKSLQKMELNVDKTFAWTDSTIVLSWLNREASNWSTFVANRVAEIQESLNLRWNHVLFHENPADCASRGVDPSSLKQLSLWWQGPEWLITGALPKKLELPTTKEELKRKNLVNVSQVAESEDIIDLSAQRSLRKALRIVAYVKRFISICKYETSYPNFITASELTDAMNNLLIQEQKNFYYDEINTLQTSPQVKKSSKIQLLYPFLYDGVLCVGGRLANGKFNDEAKYQRLVSQQSNLASLILLDLHHAALHAGPNQILALVRTKYWISSCRNLIRKIVRNCVSCCRFQTRANNPLMGDLPKERIDVPLRAFQDIDIDFEGPFLCKTGGSKEAKVYIALFICFASRAVHLDLVSDLSSQAFIAALRRFVSRRGCPKRIFTDNGTNFTGAQAELKELQILLVADHSDSLQAYLAGLSVVWTFIPPRAPHSGGLWEAAIKRAKKHLRRVMGKCVLNYEELETLFCQIEMVLNSRPISSLSDDPKDELPLTPADLCMGAKLEALPSTAEVSQDAISASHCNSKKNDGLVSKQN